MKFFYLHTIRWRVRWKARCERNFMFDVVIVERMREGVAVIDFLIKFSLVGHRNRQLVQWIDHRFS